MRKTAAGRADEFVALLDQHRQIMYKVANAYCRVNSDRDDLIAEMTAALWSSFGRYDAAFRFSTWMYRVVLNVAISASRAERRRRSVDCALESATEIGASADEETDADLDRLNAFIADLPDLDKALMLLFLDEHSYDSIAAIVGLSKTNVATKLGRLKERARITLNSDADASQGDSHGAR